MEWYIPITILPGIGLLIMSTASILNALSSELTYLIKDDCTKMKVIITSKITQLDILAKSLMAFYVSAAAFVLSGILAGISLTLETNSKVLVFILMLIGTFCTMGSLILLMVYAFKAVKIKRKQFEMNVK